MRNFFLVGFIIGLGFLFATDLSLEKIVKKIDENENVKSSITIGKQIIYTSSGQKRTLSIKSYSKDENDKQLLIYTGPARIKGDKILMLNGGNDIWFYTPRTDRIRHLASHAKRRKVQGSDFSYEDMAGGNLKKDYQIELIGMEKIAGIKYYKLKLIPKLSGPHYSKLILWADMKKFTTRQIDYYEDGYLLKRLTLKNFEQIGKHRIAKTMVMENLQDGGKTILETSEIRINVDLKDSIFSTNYLKKH